MNGIRSNQEPRNGEPAGQEQRSGHGAFEELAMLYAAKQLDRAERARFEAHLATCASCQAELRLWRAIGEAVVASAASAPAPARLAERALERIHAPAGPARAFRNAWQLLRAQLLLIQPDLWAASAALMLVFIALALLAERVEVIYFIAPLIAAGTLSLVFGPEHDPAMEVTLAAPTSAWKILLARLTLVSAYNLFLATGASLAMLLIVPASRFGELVLGWIGPLAFLSALALLLSMWIGTGNALAITYGLWAAQYLPFKALGLSSGALSAWIERFQQFWGDPALLVALGLALTAAALWSAGRPRVSWQPGPASLS
jgi:hypothetical protein